MTTAPATTSASTSTRRLSLVPPAPPRAGGPGPVLLTPATVRVLAAMLQLPERGHLPGNLLRVTGLPGGVGAILERLSGAGWVSASLSQPGPGAPRPQPMFTLTGQGAAWARAALVADHLDRDDQDDQDDRDDPDRDSPDRVRQDQDQDQDQDQVPGWVLLLMLPSEMWTRPGRGQVPSPGDRLTIVRDLPAVQAAGHTERTSTSAPTVLARPVARLCATELARWQHHLHLARWRRNPPDDVPTHVRAGLVPTDKVQSGSGRSGLGHLSDARRTTRSDPGPG